MSRVLLEARFKRERGRPSLIEHFFLLSIVIVIIIIIVINMSLFSVLQTPGNPFAWRQLDQITQITGRLRSNKH